LTASFSGIPFFDKISNSLIVIESKVDNNVWENFWLEEFKQWDLMNILDWEDEKIDIVHELKKQASEYLGRLKTWLYLESNLTAKGIEILHGWIKDLIFGYTKKLIDETDENIIREIVEKLREWCEMLARMTAGKKFTPNVFLFQQFSREVFWDQEGPYVAYTRYRETSKKFTQFFEMSRKVKGYIERSRLAYENSRNIQKITSELLEILHLDYRIVTWETWKNIIDEKNKKYKKILVLMDSNKYLINVSVFLDEIRKLLTEQEIIHQKMIYQDGGEFIDWYEFSEMISSDSFKNQIKMIYRRFAKCFHRDHFSNNIKILKNGEQTDLKANIIFFYEDIFKLWNGNIYKEIIKIIDDNPFILQELEDIFWKAFEILYYMCRMNFEGSMIKLKIIHWRFRFFSQKFSQLLVVYEQSGILDSNLMKDLEQISFMDEFVNIAISPDIPLPA